MKRILMSLAIIVLTFSLYSQQYIAVEAKYLYLINNQNRKAIIKDNIRNAELVLDSLIFKYRAHPYGDEFLNQLAISYLRIGKPQMAYLIGLLYLDFYADSVKNSDIERIILIAAHKSGKTNFDLQTIIDDFSYNKSQNTDFLFIIKEGILLKSRYVDKFLSRLIDNLQKAGYELPYWAKQWKFFTDLGFSPEKKLRWISFDYEDKEVNSVKDYYSGLPKFAQNDVKLKLCLKKKF